ncbi:tyrosine-type recombinase/integrase [Labilibaculum sp.]|uniref:site-specific integrase n=1 Tax=Labilibaculum sp. TaxID=2060723 RepID=UPI0035683900
MATIRFIVKRKAELMPIYLRLRHGKNVDLSKDTSFKVLPEDWNLKKQQPKGTTEQGKIIALNLSKLKTSLLSNFNEAIENGISITPEWLADQINIIQNRGTSEQQEKGNLLTYTDYYINYLPTHVQRSGKRGVSKNTIKKFVTLKARLVDLQEAKNRKYNVSDINPDFINLFDAFLRKNNYSDNYIGTLSINLKTMCKNARKDGLNVSPNLDNITGVKEDTEKIILTFKEIEQIKKTSYKREALSNARDWLIIGCFTGQRVSDLLKLTKDNIVFKSGLQLIELTQIKTGKKISLPLHPEVKEILDKREGYFPYKISDVKFNLYIKEVCKLAGIDQLINGSKINPKTKRKEKGVYPKYELITSHTCRRSFASNYYGDIPTPLLMSATGHATEKKFLIYIGKSATDQAQQLAEYWTKETLEAKQETQLKIIKKAN